MCEQARRDESSCAGAKGVARHGIPAFWHAPLRAAPRGVHMLHALIARWSAGGFARESRFSLDSATRPRPSRGRAGKSQEGKQERRARGARPLTRRWERDQARSTSTAVHQPPPMQADAMPYFLPRLPSSISSVWMSACPWRRAGGRDRSRRRSR